MHAAASTGPGCTGTGSSILPLRETTEVLGVAGPVVQLNAPSRGSSGHPDSCGLPCKYFWKPRGCKDGASCVRCHLCPWQPLLARSGGSSSSVAAKAASVATSVAGTAAKAEQPPCVTNSAEPGAIAAPARSDGQPNGAIDTGPAKASQTRDQRLFENAMRYKDLSNDELEAVVPRREDGTLTSIGTFLHASKQCTRCIYFDSVQGCPNGLRCKFCHGDHPAKEPGRGHKRALEDEREAGPGASRLKAPRVVCDKHGNSRPSWLQDDEDEAPSAYRYGGYSMAPAAQQAWTGASQQHHWTQPWAAPCGVQPQQQWGHLPGYPPPVAPYGYAGRYWPPAHPSPEPGGLGHWR
mmetsp:Transcript_8730/g.27066  ORF Transcript_8730/g.27066 Transcript_8730/m.27066 type:complete len:351 (+) Transcript_8730:92-1144(+)